MCQEIFPQAAVCLYLYSVIFNTCMIALLFYTKLCMPFADINTTIFIEITGDSKYVDIIGQFTCHHISLKKSDCQLNCSDQQLDFSFYPMLR